MKNTILKSAFLAAAVSVAPLAATAATLDLTDNTSFDTATATSATGTVDGVGFTITSNPAGELTFLNGPTGDTCDILACLSDGLGVSDDEITNDGTTTSIVESVTVAFDQVVTVTGLYFLDLFISDDDQHSQEEANVSVDSGPTHSGFLALELVNGTNSGFAFYGGQSLTGSSFTFTASNTNDNVGFADFALAGIELAPIPLPAGFLLLGGALGALGVARRRKTA